MKPLVPNTLLQNRYLVVHLIGKGGMGDVYLAVDQRLGSAVALKRTFFADDVMLGNAFEREAKTLARLRHPVLPKVSDHFTENGEQYLVMEHISGEDISKRLESANKPFPFSWVLFWADQMLDALSYLHSHEPPIIHRDIKPQNLKLTDENHIILLDFGLSKNNAGESRVVSGSKSGSSIVGYTPHYAPMEQIRGTGTNQRSDLYSLSATVYQMLTNTIPADALTRADSMLNALPDPIRPISEINPEVSKAVSGVILKGMEVSQDKRWATAREMQKTLRDAYAQMQNQMSAQTMAFNVNDIQSAEIPPTQQKSESVNSAPLNSGLLPTPSSHSAVNSGQFGSQPAASESNFDATLRMDAMPTPLPNNVADAGTKQSDVKTEVFLAGNLAGIIPPTPPVKEGSFGREEKYHSPENFSSDSFGQASNADSYSPNATMPPFNLEQQNGQSANTQESGFYTNSAAAESNTGEYTDFSATRNFNVGESFAGQSEERNFDSQPASAPPVAKTAVPIKKKSSGKIVGVIVGLGALLVLAVGAAAGVYYYQKDRAAVVEDLPPTPAPTVEFSPTVTPSPETTPNEANTGIAEGINANSGNVNANGSNVGISGQADNTNVIKTPLPTPAIENVPRPTPIKPTINSVRTPIPPIIRPPVVKPPPTKKDDRPKLPNQ